MAQQVCYWDGSVDTDWATAGNWTGTVERVPLSANGGDIAVFDARQVTKPTTGMADDGASNSGHTDNAELSLIHFKEGYTGGIGTAALPLCTSAAKIIIEGTGTYYINCAETDQSTDTIIEALIINNPSAIVYLFSNCNDAAQLAEFTKVFLVAGTLHVAWYSADNDDTGCYIKDLYIIPRHGNASEATCTLEKDAYDDKGNVATNIYMDTGTLTVDSPVGIFYVRDGTVYYGSEKSTGTANQIDVAGGREQLNITELRMSSGTFHWLPDVNSGTPTITLAYIFGGKFDCDDTISSDITKTITTIYAFVGATLDFKNDRGNITVTNLYNHGARIETDFGSKIGITYNQP